VLTKKRQPIAWFVSQLAQFQNFKGLRQSGSLRCDSTFAPARLRSHEPKGADRARDRRASGIGNRRLQAHTQRDVAIDGIHPQRVEEAPIVLGAPGSANTLSPSECAPATKAAPLPGCRCSVQMIPTRTRLATGYDEHNLYELSHTTVISCDARTSLLPVRTGVVLQLITSRLESLSRVTSYGLTPLLCSGSIWAGSTRNSNSRGRFVVVSGEDVSPSGGGAKCILNFQQRSLKDRKRPSLPVHPRNEERPPRPFASADPSFLNASEGEFCERRPKRSLPASPPR